MGARYTLEGPAGSGMGFPDAYPAGGSGGEAIPHPVRFPGDTELGDYRRNARLHRQQSQIAENAITSYWCGLPGN